MSSIEFTQPGEMEGEPAEVAERAVAQLAAIAMSYAAVIESTVKQVENAGRQAALDAGVDVGDEPGALDEWWRENKPAQAARAEALRVVAERIPGGVRALHSALHQDR